MGQFKEKLKSLAIYTVIVVVIVLLFWIPNTEGLFNWVPASIREAYNSFVKFALLYQWYLMIGMAILFAVIFLWGAILEAIKTIFRK